MCVGICLCVLFYVPTIAILCIDFPCSSSNLNFACYTNAIRWRKNLLIQISTCVNGWMQTSLSKRSRFKKSTWETKHFLLSKRSKKWFLFTPRNLLWTKRWVDMEIRMERRYIFLSWVKSPERGLYFIKSFVWYKSWQLLLRPCGKNCAN